jgi:undecaprenyl-diphosphatase
VRIIPVFSLPTQQGGKSSIVAAITQGVNCVLTYDFWLTLVSEHGDTLILLVGLVACLETLAFVGLALPGVAILFALAALAGNQQLSLAALLLSAFIGALIGDQISFLLGRFASPWLVRSWPLRRHPDWLPRGQRFFARYGGASVVIGRFVGPIRPLIPFVAGSCGMPLLRFSLFNIASAAAWAPAYLLPGYLTGISAHWLPLLQGPVLVLVVTLLTLLLAFQQFHLRLHPDARLWHWLQQRRMPPRLVATGLLTLATTLLFGALIAVQLSGHLTETNTRLYELLHTLGQQMPLLAHALTDAADPALVLSLALLTGLIAQLRERQYQGWGVALGVAATLILNHLLKEWLQIPRPPIGEQALDSYSFPSGHASAAAAFYALFAVWLLQGQSHRIRHVGYLLTAGWIVLLGFSRTLLGVHWPLDVAAGIAEGVSVAGLYRLWLLRQPPARAVPLTPTLTLAGAGILLFVGARQLLGG